MNKQIKQLIIGGMLTLGVITQEQGQHRVKMNNYNTNHTNSLISEHQLPPNSLNSENWKTLLKVQKQSGLKHVEIPAGNDGWKIQQQRSVVEIFRHSFPSGSGTLVRIVQLDPDAERNKVPQCGRKAKVIMGLLTNHHVVDGWGRSDILNGVKFRFGHSDELSPLGKLSQTKEFSGTDFKKVDYEQISTSAPLDGTNNADYESTHLDYQFVPLDYQPKDWKRVDVDSDNKEYTKQEFIDYYGGSREWDNARDNCVLPRDYTDSNDKFLEDLNALGFGCHTIFIGHPGSKELKSVVTPWSGHHVNWKLFGQTTLRAQAKIEKPIVKGDNVRVRMYTDPIGRIASQNGQAGNYFQLPIDEKYVRHPRCSQGDRITIAKKFDPTQPERFILPKSGEIQLNRIQRNLKSGRDLEYVDESVIKGWQQEHQWVRNTTVEVKLSTGKHNCWWTQQTVDSRKFNVVRGRKNFIVEFKLKIIGLKKQPLVVRVDKYGEISGEWKSKPWSPHTYVQSEQEPLGIVAIRKRDHWSDEKTNTILDVQTRNIGGVNVDTFVVQVDTQSRQLYGPNTQRGQYLQRERYVFVDYTRFDVRPLSEADDKISEYDDVDVDKEACSIQIYQFPYSEPLRVNAGNVIEGECSKHRERQKQGKQGAANFDHSCSSQPGGSGASMWVNHNSTSSPQHVTYPSLVGLNKSGQNYHFTFKEDGMTLASDYSQQGVEIEPILREIAHHGFLYGAFYSEQSALFNRKNRFQECWKKISWDPEGWLPNDWRAKFHGGWGATYYYKIGTSQWQWEKPECNVEDMAEQEDQEKRRAEWISQQFT